MVLLQIVILVFLVRVQAEDQTEVRVHLGQSVTLNCSVAEQDLYWYMEIHSGLRCCILRTFGPRSFVLYVFPFSQEKFNIAGNRLVISNITADDYRRYFCARKEDSGIVFGDSFRLVSDVGSVDHQAQPRPCGSVLDRLIMYGSFTLKLLFLVVGSGLVFQRVKKTCRRQEEAPQYENSTWKQRVEGAESDPRGAGRQITVVNRV